MEAFIKRKKERKEDKREGDAPSSSLGEFVSVQIFIQRLPECHTTC